MVASLTTINMCSAPVTVELGLKGKENASSVLTYEVEESKEAVRVN